jgi:hypothetical protein
VAGAQRHYRGWSYREHRPTDDRATRQGRLLASLSNETSFWLTEASLVELLEDLGFASVGRCSAPTNPAEADDRATFVARKQPAPEIRSFPWINTASRREVENRSASPRQTLFMPPVRGPMASAQLATVLCLGDWVRRHPDFTVGNRGGPIADQRLGIWRRADLDDYVGGLRRVPPILVVELGRDEETLRRRAELYLAAGTRTVWLVLVETAELAVVDPSGATRFAAAQALPQIAELPDLRPRAGELLLL